MSYVNCKLCPRACGADRTVGAGFCGAPAIAMVAKTMLHQWEEPVLAGSGGSGAIFFSGCNLGCTYCQNRAISRHITGTPMDGPALRCQMEALVAQGAENIDLVTAAPYLPTVLEALEQPLGVPVIYNTGGYEAPDAIARLAGKVDIYLPDLKYAEPALAKQLSQAPDYFAVATAAISQMVEQTGPVQLKDGRLTRGVIIRHLILPGQVENSLKILDWIGETFKKGEVLVSLMRQYTPMPGLPAPFDRPITTQEYEAVLSWMFLNNLQGFTQDASAADTCFIPEF